MKFDVVTLGVDHSFELGIQVYQHNMKVLSEVSNNFYYITESKLIKNGVDIEEYESELTFEERVERVLEKTDTTYVFVLLDDFYINLVNDVHALYDLVEDYSPDYIRLRAKPANGHRVLEHKKFNLTSAVNLYRINTQPSLWKKSALLRILDSRISPWTMEMSYGIKKTSLLGATFTANKDIIVAYELIKKGRYRPILCRLLKLKVSSLKSLGIIKDLQVIFVSYMNVILFRLRVLK